MSQRDLASAAGVPQATVGRIEAGLVSPRIDTMVRLLRATGHELAVERRPGEGVDRTLIRAALERSPEERIEAAGLAGRNLAAFLSQVQRERREPRA